MNAIMSYYFLSQRYEREYSLFKKVENDLKHDSLNAIHATPLSHKFDNHLEVKYKTPHFTAVIIALRLKIRVSRNTHHSRMQYVHAKSDNLY